MAFLSSPAFIALMSGFTILFILGFMGYVFWKLIKLSNHKPQAGEKIW